MELALQQLPGGKLKGRYFLAHKKRMLDVDALAAKAMEVDHGGTRTNPFAKLHGSELLRGVLRLTSHGDNRLDGVPEKPDPHAPSLEEGAEPRKNSHVCVRECSLGARVRTRVRVCVRVCGSAAAL